MNGSAHAAVKTQLTLSSNGTSQNYGVLTAYAEVVSHPLRRYSTEAFITKADEKISNFKQDSIMP